MPDMDGVAMLREIRAVDSDVCVIVMTAYPSVESAVDTMKADAFDYLGKPFELDQLRAVLQRAIRDKGLLIDEQERGLGLDPAQACDCPGRHDVPALRGRLARSEPLRP